MKRPNRRLLQKTIKSLKQQLSPIKKQKSCTIFTGTTGCGKGTLIHYLSHNPNLNAQLTPSGQMCIFITQRKHSILSNLSTSSLDKIQISSSLTSCTSIPFCIEYKGNIFYDMPGFFDNRLGFINQEVLNSYFIQEVFQKIQNVRIVYLTTRTSFMDKAKTFLQAVQYFVHTINDLQTIKSSIILIVTKVPLNFEIKNVVFLLKNVLNDFSKQISKQAKNLINYWIEDQSRIDLFQSPNRQGHLDFKNADKLLQKIKKIPFSLSPKVTINISQNSIISMLQLQQKCNQQISELCYQIVNIVQQQFLSKLSSISLVKQTRSSLNFFRRHLLNLLQQQNVQLFFQYLKVIIELNPQQKTYEKRVLIQQLVDYYQAILFFQQKSLVKFNLSIYKQKIYKIQKTVGQVAMNTWDQMHKQTVYIKGFLVQSAKVHKKIQQYKQQYNKKLRIIIFAYFFIMNQDIQYNGGDIMIYAEYFKVVQNFTKIKLNGENAKDYSVLTADDNKHGQPGRPGMNSGNLLLHVYRQCQGLKDFSVDLRGGRGGRGKNGGQIKTKNIKRFYIDELNKDKTLPTPQKCYLQSRQDYKFSQRNIFSKFGEVIRMLSSFNGQVIQFYSTQSKIGSLQGDFLQTEGGAGGYPGHSGNLHIDIGDQTLIIINQSQQSLNGMGHIQVYQGYYVKQLMFPNFRDQGKEININSYLQEERILKQEKQVQKQMQEIRERKIQRHKKFDSIKNQQSLFQLLFKEAQQQLREQQINTPVKFKKIYKNQMELYRQDTMIRQQDQQNQQNGSIGSLLQQNSNKNFNNATVRKTKFINQRTFQKQFNPKIDNILKRKTPKKSRLLFSESRTQQQIQKINTSSKISMNSSFNRKNTNQTLSMPKLGRNISQVIQDLSRQSTKQIKYNQKLQSQKIISQFSKQVATDIGTDAVQKIAQKLFNKICEKIVKNGFTMQKQVMIQFLQNSIKNQAQKKLLSQLGLLTGQNLLSKVAIHKIQQTLITNLGKQLLKDSANILQRQALKKLGQNFAKQGIKNIGKQTIRQAELQIAAKSLGSGGVQGMLVGLGKSIILQVGVSAFLASGITDEWLVKPHFKSKRLDLGIYNYQNIQQPTQFKDFTQQQIQSTTQQYKQFIYNFQQLNLKFADKK